MEHPLPPAKRGFQLEERPAASPPLKKPMTRRRAVLLMIAVTAMWSIAGVVTRHLEHARSFELTFWRSFFTVVSLLVILPALQGREVFRKIARGGAPLWISG